MSLGFGVKSLANVGSRSGLRDPICPTQLRGRLLFYLQAQHISVDTSHHTRWVGRQMRDLIVLAPTSKRVLLVYGLVGGTF